MANQAKLKSFRTAPRYMYGFKIPRNFAHAIWLDTAGRHTKWQDSTVLEMAQLAKYNIFTDKGINGDPGPDFTKYNFKLKGSREISFHLGCDFFRDEDGTLCMKPEKYISKMVQGYEQMSGCTPKRNVYSPLEKGDHPELDSSDLCDRMGAQKYQSLIGSLQWAVSIGCIDITTAVMTLSSFHAVPRKGHLKRAKCVVSYVAKFKESTIRFRTQEPDYSDIPALAYDWECKYNEAVEDVPTDAPTPLGKFVVIATHVDANLCHNLVTGKSVSGILHWLNGTPIDWFSKKQGAVETATYGSEFMAARLSVEQIKTLRDTIRYLGVPLRTTSYVFGDNKSVVDSPMHINA
jgi:hypothetical protein